MGVLVFNVNATTPQQSTEAQAIGKGSLIPNNASATQGMTTPTMGGAKAVSTTGVLVAGYTAKQAYNLVTQNVGRLTGNSHLQNQVNIGMKVGATAVGLMTNPIITSMALAFDGINYGINTYFTERDDKIRASQARAIAGTMKGMKH